MTIPKSHVHDRAVTGPLAGFKAEFRDTLLGRGYTPLSASSLVGQVALLSRWLDANGRTAKDLTAQCLDEFLVDERVRFARRHSRGGLMILVEMLVSGGVVIVGEVPVTPPTGIDADVVAFIAYCMSERGLVRSTAVGYVHELRSFLDWLRDSATALDLVTAAQVTGSIVRRAKTATPSGTMRHAAALRSFLRFCFVTGRTPLDLSGAAMPVTGRRRSLLPKALSRSEVDALLGSVDRDTAAGCRDYALMLLMLRMGLRAGEVVALRLDDLDWAIGEVVVRGKGRRTERLPLPFEVGEAIAAYLQFWRPAVEHRQVFLRLAAPIGPIGRGALNSLLYNASDKAGMSRVSSHRLRHTIALDMVQVGVPLTEIGMVLRHESIETTSIYARADVETLRRLARPWPVTAGVAS